MSNLADHIICNIGERDGPIEHLSYTYFLEVDENATFLDWDKPHFDFRVIDGQIEYEEAYWQEVGSDEIHRDWGHALPSHLRQQYNAIVAQPGFAEALKQSTLEAIDDLHERLLALAARTKLRPNGADFGTTHRS